MTRQLAPLPPLNPDLLAPSRVVLVGASAKEGSLGKAVLDNLIVGTPRFTLQTVNPKPLPIPKADHYKSLADLPQGTGLAVLAIPAEAVPDAIETLGRKGVGLAVVISAGLGCGTRAGGEMLEAARRASVRIIGPNCLGLILPHQTLNASFARTMPIAGDLAFLSQSGAIITAMLEWAQPRAVGFSGVVSVGDMAQTDLGELIDLYAKDENTRAILLYLEGITEAERFLDAASRASRIKPVIALKAGRTSAARKAALSHTGSLAGSWEVYSAAFRESGIVVADTLEGMFDAANALHFYPHTVGKRLAIVTNGGGAGILAADALKGTGTVLTQLHADTLARLSEALPPTWSHANPVDIIGDADASRYEAAIREVIRDDQVDAVMVMNCPTALLEPGEAAQATASAVKNARRDGISKPVLACWMGDENLSRAMPILQSAGIPAFKTPADAACGFGAMVSARLARERHCSQATEPADEVVIAKAHELLEAVANDDRTVLSEIEAKRLLALFGIPVTETQLIARLDDVEAACETITAPYALKIVSPAITHKSDHGGVALGLADAGSVRRAAKAMYGHISKSFPMARIDGFALQPMIAQKSAHELFAGIANDATFGPIILFGAGGTAIEVIADKAIGIPVVGPGQAQRMIAQTRISRLLDGYRHIPAADKSAISSVLVALSQIAISCPQIAELDINPMLADADGVIGLDARVILAKHSAT